MNNTRVNLFQNKKKIIEKYFRFYLLKNNNIYKQNTKQHIITIHQNRIDY